MLMKTQVFSFYQCKIYSTELQKILGRFISNFHMLKSITKTYLTYWKTTKEKFMKMCCKLMRAKTNNLLLTEQMKCQFRQFKRYYR